MLYEKNCTPQVARDRLGAFLFQGEDVFKSVGNLSGGEQSRLRLCMLMDEKINLLILDEPTNHLDIASREALESALEQFDGTIVTVSHDRYLIDKLATRILELKPGEYFAGDLLDFHVDHTGKGYTEFMDYKNARIAERTETAAAASSAPAAMGSGKEQYLKNKQAAADARKKKAQTERLQKECAALEAELEQIEEELFGSAASDYQRAARLDTRKNEVEERLMEIYELLEELEA
jgi:ABC-type multidrug transport system ATPase subunit